MRPRTSTLTILILLLLASCGPAPRDPEPRSDLVGIWDLQTVDGVALPAPSPEEPNVMLRSITMTLAGDGDYALLSVYRMQGQADDTQATIGGSWVATDRALTFYNEGAGPAVVEFGYRLDGATLSATDEIRHVWVLRRR